MAEELKVVITGDDNLTPVLRGVQDGLMGVGRIAGTVFRVGAIAAAAGAAALGAGLAVSINEAMEAQEVQAQLAAVLQSTGGVAGVTADMANELASSLTRVTRFGDEAILAGENMLLTFTQIGSDVFPQATQTMLDMSQALGQDLQSSAIQLGKALQDPITGVTALRRVGVNFTEEQQEMIKSLVESGNLLEAQTFILQELQTEFGGSAEAAGQTFAGQLDILKNSLANVAEEVGTKLLPIAGELLTSFGGLVQQILPVVVAFFEGTLLPIIEDVAGSFGTFFEGLTAGANPLEAARVALQQLIPPELADKLVLLISKALELGGSLLGLTGDMAGTALGGEDFKLTLDDVLKALDDIIFVISATRDVVEDMRFAWVTVIEPVIEFIRHVQNLKRELLGIKLPPWLTPGSPTPLEIGLRGATEAMRGLSAETRNLQTTNNYNLTINSNAPSEPVIADFALLKVLAGV